MKTDDNDAKKKERTNNDDNDAKNESGLRWDETQVGPVLFLRTRKSKNSFDSLSENTFIF